MFAANKSWGTVVNETPLNEVATQQAKVALVSRSDLSQGPLLFRDGKEQQPSFCQ